MSDSWFFSITGAVWFTSECSVWVFLWWWVVSLYEEQSEERPLQCHHQTLRTCQVTVSILIVVLIYKKFGYTL